jgi:hypothetical protein
MATPTTELWRWDEKADELIPVCPGCSEDITGSCWGPQSLCLDCHQARMLPAASFHDEYLSSYNESTGADY